MGPAASVTVPAARADRADSRCFLIQDPHHEYAVRFIEAMHRRFGLRAICFYTNRRERLRRADQFPLLRSDLVVASYDVARSDLVRFAAHLRVHHRVAAVVPFIEPTVLPATELGELLGLSWAQPVAMRRVCDKLAFKRYLREQHPHIRINASRSVRSGREVRAALREPAYRRFVIKPNSGFGNRAVGLFDASTPEDAVGDFLYQMRAVPLVMEEYVEGEEYFVNGQVDAAGRVLSLAAFQYLRRPANGRHNLDFETQLLPYGDPRFAQLTRYAEDVVQASGLTRTPFHLELKLDAQGPCLIEVGARLAGHGNALLCGELHGARLDLVDLAAHYYVSADDYGPVPLDWKTYDGAAVRYVHGLADRRERIYDLQGVAGVEALTSFQRWVQRPAIGQMLERTADSLSMPYSLLLRGPSQEALTLDATEARALLHWNTTGAWPRRALVEARCFAERVRNAVTARLSMLREPQPRHITPIARVGISRGLWSRASRLAVKVHDSLLLRWQMLGIGHTLDAGAAAARAREAGASSHAVLRWASEYIARPHPSLGRGGAICPFMQPSLELGRFEVWQIDELDSDDLARLRRSTLEAARAFLNLYPIGAPKNSFASVALTFPRLCGEQLLALDTLHDQLKTHLVARYDLMSTPCHPFSRKPSVSNPDFAVFRSPVPLIVLRHLDVRDIRFLDTNERGFRRYHARFAPQYARGEVSDEFGYVRRYEEARSRFGLAASTRTETRE
jgi:ATP-grasp domain